MTSNTTFESYDDIVKNLRGDSTEDVVLHIQAFLMRKGRVLNLSTSLADVDFSTVDFVVRLVKNVLPNARYGFDYNPVNQVKLNKDGVQISSPGQAWVKYSAVDHSISHKNPGQAMLIALMLVLRDLEVMEKHDARKNTIGS